MKSVDRHYRLSPAAYERIQSRDTDRFPTEKDFVSEAILSYHDRIDLKELNRKMDELDRKMSTIIRSMGW